MDVTLHPISREVDFGSCPAFGVHPIVHLALAAWREGLLDHKELGEMRGREVDEERGAGLWDACPGVNGY